MMDTIPCSIILIAVTLGVGSQEAPRIRTELGDLVGVIEHNVSQFRNIPFAKPPVGNLRFAKPLAHGPWTGVLDASKFGSYCVQPSMLAPNTSLSDMNQSEDCLSLNIYVPGQLTSQANKSVMVWIYGGAYITGQAMSYDGSYLAVTGDVIVVTLNYRVGIFGFLSTLNTDLPGNYGLWDMRLAFEWVHNNIASFGGNPASVTIFGESSGGFSVSLQAVHPDNKGLFHRVIGQSGSSLSPGSTVPNINMLNISRDLGSALGCINSSEYASCMRSISPENILKAQLNIFQKYSSEGKSGSYIGPVVDHDFLQDLPHILLGNKSSESYKFFLTLDYMAGVVSQEGTVYFFNIMHFAQINHFNISLGIPESIFCQDIGPDLINTYFQHYINKSMPTNAVCTFYGSSDMAVQANKALDAAADVMFVVPAVSLLNIHAKESGGSTYHYLFERPTPGEPNPSFIPWFTGAPHGSEIAFLFGLQDYPSEYNITLTPGDLLLSKRMMRYWTNFAKTGDPNSDDLPRWEMYNSALRPYLNLDTVVSMKRNMFEDRVALWLNSRQGETLSIIFGR